MSLTMNANIRICLFYLLIVGVFSVKIWKNYGTSFSCGRLLYRSLTYNEKHDQVFVGSMDWLFRLNMENINRTACENGTDALNIKSKSKSVEECEGKKNLTDYHCRNHISVTKKWSAGDTEYFCGTNAYDPVVFSLKLQSHTTPMKDLEIKYHSFRAETGRCPSNPDSNYTAMEINEKRFVGSGVDDESITAISEHILNANSVEQAKKSYIRTDKDSKYLNSPHFVTSFRGFSDVRVYFIFRELANLKSSGGTYISRIGTVCIKDKGVNYQGRKVWGSYLKASLKCETKEIKYDNILDVTRQKVHYNVMIGLFTTQDSQGSAICEYSMIDDINEKENLKAIFKGSFEQDFSERNPVAVDSKLVPDKHPFECPSDDPDSIPDSTKNFTIHYPLMHNAFLEEPDYHTKNHNYTKIVFVGSNVSLSRGYSVYAGTTKGTIHQLVYFNKNDRWFYHILDIIEITPPAPIRAMLYATQKTSLFVSSDNAVHQFDLSQCEKRFSNCLECTRDRLCAWHKRNNKCVYAFPLNGDVLYEDRWAIFSDICENYIKPHEGTLIIGHRNRIKCQSIFATEGTLPHVQEKIVWYTCHRELICEDSERYACTNNTLIIKYVEYYNKQCYVCKLGKATLYRVHFVVSTIDKAKSVTAIEGQTLQVRCQNSAFKVEKFPVSDVNWFPCGDSKDVIKIYETSKKPSNENYALVLSPVSKKDEGCHVCETETRVLFSFNLRVIIPRKTVVTPGSTVNLECGSRWDPSITTASPSPSIVWLKTRDQKNSTEITAKVDKYSFQNNILIIESVGTQDKGYYNCKIGEVYIMSYELIIFKIIPELYVLNYDLTAHLSCKNTSKSDVIVWLKSTDLESFTKIKEDPKKYSIKENSLNIKSVDHHDEKYYNCKIKTDSLYSYDVKVVRIYSASPLHVVNEGQPAHLECLNELFKKIDIKPSDIKWYKCENKDTPIVTGTKKYLFKHNNLSISVTNDQDKGCYSCNVNETTLRKVNLILLNVTSQVYDAKLHIKSTIVCKNPMIPKAEIPAKHVQWYRCNNEKNETQLSNRTMYKFKGYNLIISSVQKEDLGCYICKYGEVRLHIANLAIPKIIKPPRRGGACGRKYTLWKYVIFMHVFTMVVKTMF